MSNEETTKIGTNKKFMKKFLTIVKEKVVAVKVDNTFTTTLTTLWNLTGEFFYKMQFRSSQIKENDALEVQWCTPKQYFQVFLTQSNGG